jgi:hypothetical protein
MAVVQTSEVAANPASVSLEVSRAKCGNHCWATQESIDMTQFILLELTVGQEWDPRMPVVQQLDLGKH